MQNKKGFTIIELIVVIAIIAILAAVVMVNVTQYINKSKDSAIQADMNSIQTAAMACYADVDGCNADYTKFFGATPPSGYGNYATISAAIIKQKSQTLTPSTSTTAFCLQAALATTGNWCVDGDGFGGKGTCSAQKCTASS